MKNKSRSNRLLASAISRVAFLDKNEWLRWIVDTPFRNASAWLSAVVFALVGCWGVSAAQSVSSVEAQPPMLDFGYPCNNPLDSVENSRTSQKGPGISFPSYRRDRPPVRPPYPPFAQRSNQEGTVLLKIYVTDEGRVGRVEVAKTSGWPLLDNAAMEGVRDWLVKPGEKYNKPVCMWAEVPVSFRLETYSSDELRAAKITPGAEMLSKHIIGESMGQYLLQKMGEDEDEVTVEAMRKVFSALTAQPSWRGISHDVAAILSIEMEPEEIAELNEYFSKPVMQKYFSVAPKFMSNVRNSQRVMADVIQCVGNEMGAFARKNVAINVSEEALPKAMLERIPRLVEAFTSFCICSTKSKQDPTKPLDCGKRPELKW